MLLCSLSHTFVFVPCECEIDLNSFETAIIDKDWMITKIGGPLYLKKILAFYDEQQLHQMEKNNKEN